MTDPTDRDQFRDAWRSLIEVTDAQARRFSESNISGDQYDALLSAGELRRRDIAAQRLSDLLGYSTSDIIIQGEVAAWDMDYPAPDELSACSEIT